MRAVSTVRGKAIPLDRSNVDTDQIIPAKHLKRIERTGYGPFAFEAWRRDPDFVLNDPAYQGARIMLTRQNFGSGSSREHAVWALEGLGIEALIGVSFADIFKNNCFQGGMLTVELPSEDIEERAQHPYTKALLGANPIDDPDDRRPLTVLQGDVPSPYDLPKGCPFAGRCPLVQPRCREERPPLEVKASGHPVACWEVD